MSKQRSDALHFGEQVREGWYRVLSYYFGLRSNSDVFQDYPQRILERFEVPHDPNEDRKPPTPGLPPVYSLVETAPSESLRFRVLFQEHMLYGSDAPGPVLDHFFWHVNTEAIRHTGDYFLIHAGVVTANESEAILLPGTSGSGKSTLVAGLVMAGFGYLSDEAAAIDPITRIVHPFPRPISLKPDVIREVFPQLMENDPAPGVGKGQWHIPADELRPDSEVGPADARWIFFPTYRADQERVHLEELSRAESALELGRNSMSLGRYGPRALPLLADLMRETHSYRIVYGDLESAVDTIKRITGLASARQS